MSPQLLFGFLFLSLSISMVLIVPFIGLLYKINFKRARQKTLDAFGNRTPIFDKFHADKAGTPVGGGMLVIAVVSVLLLVAMMILDWLELPITYNYQSSNSEVGVLIFTFLSFGLIGLYDDIKKFFGFEKTGFFGLRMRTKFLIQLVVALVIAWWLYSGLAISILNVPFLGTIDLGWLYVPFATLVIVSFANAVNITDGLDGLAGGVTLICLLGLWIISYSILDVPLSIFICLFIGSLISFVYFNVFPARIFLGDVGALSFGAVLAVIGLLLGKPLALVIIGGIFVIEVSSSLIQLVSKKFWHRKALPVAPIHLYLQKIGWQEPKIVQRFWLVQVILALFAVWVTLL